MCGKSLFTVNWGVVNRGSTVFKKATCWNITTYLQNNTPLFHDRPIPCDQHRLEEQQYEPLLHQPIPLPGGG